MLGKETEDDFFPTPNENTHSAGWKVLGKIQLDNDQAATAVSAFQSAVSGWIPQMMPSFECFIPRHGLRVTSGGHTYDFVLCYECGSMEISRDQKHLASLPAFGFGLILNQMLIRAHIPLG